MAQVYQFVDDNGVTRLFAEIVPDPAGTPFNGGTITGALTINKALAPSTSDRVIDILDPNNTDAEIDFSRSVDGSGNENVGLTLAPALDGTATMDLADDNFDGAVRLMSGGSSFMYARTTNAEGDGLLTLGTLAVQGSRFLRDGYFVTKLHAAPADGSLAAGDCALWFDQTDGAAKLMVKAKTANGTVATAAIALA